MEKISDIDFNIIESYISGELTPDEKKAFEDRLKREVKLLKAYTFRTKVQQYWSDAEKYEKTKNRVTTILEGKNKNRRINSFWYVAASIVILIGLSVFYYQQQPENSYNLAVNKADSTNVSNPSIQLNEQPVKGSLYNKAKIYTFSDTIRIPLNNISARSNKVLIVRQSDNQIIKDITVITSSDSLLVPLSNMQAGKYKWVFENNNISEEFIIENTAHKDSAS